MGTAKERGASASTIVSLSEVPPDGEATFFALLSALDTATTRDGKPYWRVTFRDAKTSVSQPIWGDSPLAELCRDRWKPGMFFKIRAILKIHPQFGGQFEFRQIREVEPRDRADGFDPLMCLPHSRYDSVAMFDELMAILAEKVTDVPLRKTIFSLFTKHRERLLNHPAAVHHHHAWAGGLLEHTLEVVRNGLYFAQRYRAKYTELPSLDVGIVVAGAMIHDIGKLEELSTATGEIQFTPDGGLLGHLVIGVRMLREAAVENQLDTETLLRLEHVILSHQRLPEWGSPKPPMTPEALIIHYADDLDAKLDIMDGAFQEGGPGSLDQPLTSKRNLLQYQLFRSGTSATATIIPTTDEANGTTTTNEATTTNETPDASPSDFVSPTHGGNTTP